VRGSIRQLLDLVESGLVPPEGFLVEILSFTDSVDELFQAADRFRDRFVGPEILVRGIVEFSNYCRNSCAYCGIGSRNRRIPRYRLSTQQVICTVERIKDAGIKTVVLQSGEDPGLDPYWLADLIKEIKSLGQMAVTLSVGERSKDEYAIWRKAGADRYLLKVETTDPALYQSLHPGMRLENRIRCLEVLRDLGYETGSGNIIGLPGQGPSQIARDLLFLRSFGLDMLAIGPFVPHPDTPLGGLEPGSMEQTLRAIALARLLCPYCNIPATSAIGTIGGDSARRHALNAGANVVMLNFTPWPYSSLYEIYPGRPGPDLAGKMLEGLMAWADENGREIRFSIGSARHSGCRATEPDLFIRSN
jgi:biotin synthase